MDGKMFCSKCGERLEADSCFCSKCGARIQNNDLYLNQNESKLEINKINNTKIYLSIFLWILTGILFVSAVFCVTMNYIDTAVFFAAAGVFMGLLVSKLFKARVMAIFIIIICLIGGVRSYAINYETEKMIDIVKEGFLSGYDRKMIGRAFDNYFKEPSWEYFESDGGVDIVEFNGICMYNSKSCKVKIQFIVRGEGFKVDHFSIDNEIQTYDVYFDLLEEIYQ